MNRNHVCVLDFETGGLDHNLSPILEIASCVIERNSLTIVDEFQSLVKPDTFDNIDDGALAVNHLTLDIIGKAPEEKLIWGQWVDWVNKYNVTKNKTTFGAPIPAGLNICNFDMKFVNRYCEKYGPWASKRKEQKLFNQIYSFDVLQLLFYFCEAVPEVEKLNISALMDYFGVDKAVQEGAHSAMFDVKFTAAILIKLLKAGRYLTAKNEDGKRRLTMKNALKGWKPT
jgi:DNA polymerase III epsilon subunit-like protein